MLQTEFRDEPLESLRAVNDIQIFALKIFYDGEFELGKIVFPVPDYDRYLGEACESARPQTPLAGDKFINALEAAFGGARSSPKPV